MAEDSVLSENILPTEASFYYAVTLMEHARAWNGNDENDENAIGCSYTGATLAACLCVFSLAVKK